MLVSSFELLINRIAPGPSSPLNRRIVQGYFLSITNFENRDVQLAIRFTASSTGNATADALRDLIPGTNANLVFDNAQQNNLTLTLLDFTSVVNGSQGFTNTRVFQTPLITIAVNSIPTIKSKQTALIALLPIVTPSIAANPNPSLEIRGCVELFQVMGFPPAQVLLNAEHRGTFLDNDFGVAGSPPSAAEQDFDQISYSLALASGKGLNILE